MFSTILAYYILYVCDFPIHIYPFKNLIMLHM